MTETLNSADAAGAVDDKAIPSIAPTDYRILPLSPIAPRNAPFTLRIGRLGERLSQYFRQDAASILLVCADACQDANLKQSAAWLYRRYEEAREERLSYGDFSDEAMLARKKEHNPVLPLPSEIMLVRPFVGLYIPLTDTDRSALYRVTGLNALTDAEYEWWKGFPPLYGSRFVMSKSNE